MWSHLTFLLFVGAAVVWCNSEDEFGWSPGQEYHYLVRSRTLTNLKLDDQYAGILVKGQLHIQAQSSNNLYGRISHPQYVRIHTTLSEGRDSEISDQLLDLRELPLSGKVFEVKLKNGLVQDLLVSSDVSTWESNFLKSVVSQLQLNTQAENAIKSNSAQVPNSQSSYGMFRTVENSVGGKCEVLYDITPLSEDVEHENSESIPLSNLDDNLISVIKTKDYSKCKQHKFHCLTTDGKDSFRLKHHNDDSAPISRSSTSHIILSGNPKKFTIQSSVTTDNILVKPRKSGSYLGAVYSKINLTLTQKQTSENQLELPKDMVSTGNLVYSFHGNFKKYPRLSPSESTESSENSGSGSEEDTSNESSLINNRGSRDSSNELMPKPSLEEAIVNPLVSYSTFYNNVDSYENIDLVQSSLSLISQLAKDLGQSESSLSESKILEKFPILVELVRSMNRKQHVELQNHLHNEYNKYSGGRVNQEVNDIFRDAVAHAGTGSALLTIREWIKSKQLAGIQAARVVSKIPKVAIAPTSDYVKAFFELITDPVVTQQQVLNTIAPTAFAAIIHKSQTCCSFQQGCYSHDAGYTYSANNKGLNETYIPYMATQLKEAVQKGDNALIQTYIFTLGYLASPRILEVFEPYLEGSQQVSDFQRMWIVTSMAALAKTHSKLVGPILFKIYLNAQEAPEVRSAAIFNYIMTNPPLSSLLRMALYTRYETSERVKSTVLNVLEDLTNTKQPKLQDLALKSRVIRKLMNLKSSSGKKTIDYYSLYYNGQVFQSISNDNSDIPDIAYLYTDNYYNLLGLPTELQYTLSNIRNVWPNVNQGESNMRKSSVERIARAINTKLDTQNQEGNVFINNLFGVQFHPFTDETINNLVKLGQDSLQGNLNLNWLDMHEEAITFSTESGLPFWQSLKSSDLFKIKLDDSHHEKSFSKSSTIESTGKFEVKLGNKVEAKFGFTTLHDHQNYIAGINNEASLQIPISYQLDNQLDKSGKRWNWKLTLHTNPSYQTNEQRMKVIHYANGPYTSIYDLFNMEPISLNKNTHLVLKSKKVSTLSHDTGSLYIEQEGEDKAILKGIDARNLVQNVVASTNEHNALYHKLDVYVNIPEGGHEIRISLVSNKLETDGDSSKHAESILSGTDGKPNSEIRRSQFLKELGSNLKSINAYVSDIDAYISLLPKQYQQQVLTIGVGNSNVDQKSQGLLYWNSQSSDGKINMEACAVEQSENSEIPSNLNDEVMGNKVNNEFTLNVRIGKSCNEGSAIRLAGSMSKSNDWRENVLNSELSKQCQQNARQGKRNSLACRRITELLEMKNSMNLTMELESENHNTLTNMVVQSISEIVPGAKINTVNPRNAGGKVVNLEIKLLPDLEKTDVSVHTSKLDYTFPPCKICKMFMSPSLYTLNNLIGEESEMEGSCYISYGVASTFDKKFYPLTLGECQHVVMTTYPQQDPANPNKYLSIPEEIHVAVLAKDMNDGRHVEMIIGDDVIQMYKTDNDLHVLVNEQTIQLSQNASYRIKSGDETVAEIMILPQGFIKVISNKYEVKAIFNGMLLQLWVSNKYRNAVEGLCSNFDYEPSNDFTSPQNCIVQNPEQFSATYALTRGSCEGPALENKRKFEQSKCVKRSYRQSNVINDKETGRSSGDNQGNSYVMPRTRVMQIDNQYCFTIKPMPMCVGNSKPLEVKQRNVSLHCLPINEESYKLKQRVEKGANPDMSRRSVSRMQMMEIPVSCTMA